MIFRTRVNPLIFYDNLTVRSICDTDIPLRSIILPGASVHAAALRALTVRCIALLYPFLLAALVAIV